MISKNQFIQVLEKTTEEEFSNILFLDKRKTTNIQFNFKNNLELLDLIVHIYCVVVARTHLSPREKIALRHYLNNGYTDLAKEAIKKECKMGVSTDADGNEVLDKLKAMANLTQINFKLEKKGVLVKKHYHEREKEVNKELLALKNRFINDKAEILNIKFNKG